MRYFDSSIRAAPWNALCPSPIKYLVVHRRSVIKMRFRDANHSVTFRSINSKNANICIEIVII